MDSTGSQGAPSRRGSAAPYGPALAAAALVYLIGAWRYDWLCDDAFITFRYARNLAEGAGLVFNAGERVEGYSNFLWTVWLAVFERAGVDVTVAARVSSAACGLGVLVLLARLFAGRLGLAGPRLWAALLLPASLPPMVVWATGGLAPMPLAFFLLLSFERLVGDPERPRAVQAGLAAAAAALVRADGPLGVALVLGPLLVLGLKDRRLLRAAAVATALSLVAFTAHLLWRHGYYGEWSPNTARVKVDPNAVTFERGARYLGTFLLSFPAVLLALGTGLTRWRGLAAVAWTVVLGSCLYAVFVGGDFMAMGRFLVPALPFVALLFALGLARVSAASGSVLGVAAVVLSTLGWFDLHAVPRPLREACFFRWSTDGYRTEHEQWRMMREQAQRWTLLGRALAAHTRPGEGLIHGTIGAVGYYSRLRIHDPYGLVNTEAFKPEDADAPVRRSPGHHRRVPLGTFVTYEPEYLDAELVARDRADAGYPRWLRPGTEHGGLAEPLLLPLDRVAGAPPGLALRLIKNRKQ